MRLASVLPLVAACYASAPVASPTKVDPPATKQAPHGTIVGKVVLDGKPVPYFGVVVGELGVEGAPARPFQHADGTFSIDTYFDGGHDIIIAGPNFARRRIDDKDVPFDRVTDLGTIEVERGITIEGDVTDDTGAPMRDAIVRIDELDRPLDDTEDILTRFARGAALEATDARGHYKIEGVEPPDHMRHFFRISARSADRNLASWPLKLPATSTTINLAVAATGTIVINVTAPEDHSFWSDNLWIQPSGISRAGMLLRATDTARRIDNVPAGSYFVSYMASGTQSPGQTITVTPSATTTVSFTVP